MACMERSDHSGESDRMTTTVSGLRGYSLDTGVQAIQLSPCHPGLAGPAAWRLHGIPAFQTCCFPLRLSLSGGSGSPGAMLCSPFLLSRFLRRLSPSGRSGSPRALHSTPPVLHRDQPRRDATHFHSTLTQHTGGRGIGRGAQREGKGEARDRESRSVPGTFPGLICFSGAIVRTAPFSAPSELTAVVPTCGAGYP